MNTAKSSLVGRLAGSIETPQMMVDHLWNMEYNELPDDHLDRFLAAVNGAKSADVHRVAREHIEHDQMTMVVLGDADKIQGALGKIAQVTVVN